MKTIKSALLTVAAFIAFTVSSAASGLYIEAGTSAVGVELDGVMTESATPTDDGKNVGQLGATAVSFTYGAGYMTSRANKFGLDAGYMFTPGDAKINAKSDDSATSDVTLEIDNSREYYLAPMLNISEDASLYFKYGWNDADVSVTGDVSKPTNLSRNTVALGTVMSWGSNLYIRTEAGMTDYDSISATGLGSTGGVATDTSVKASPTVHYGKIAVGYKF